MMEFVNNKKLIPQVDSVRNFDNINTALKDIKDAKQFGKIVVTMEQKPSL